MMQSLLENDSTIILEFIYAKKVMNIAETDHIYSTDWLPIISSDS